MIIDDKKLNENKENKKSIKNIIVIIAFVIIIISLIYIVACIIMEREYEKKQENYYNDASNYCS